MNKNIRVLVVDDFSTMRKIIKSLLRNLGIDNVVEACDGRGAIQQLQAGGIDFLITDWNMPGMTGLDLLKFVRDNPKLAKLPVLMVTAESKREQIMEAARAGVNGYIVKPFTADEMNEKLSKIFARIEASN